MDSATGDPKNRAPPRNPNKGRNVARGAELDKRLDTVEEMLVRGFTNREIRVAALKLWGIRSRMAEEYVAKVYDRWRKERLANRDVIRERQIRRVTRLSRKAEDAGEIGDSLRAEALLSKLVGTEARPEDMPAPDEGETGLTYDFRFTVRES